MTRSSVRRQDRELLFDVAVAVDAAAVVGRDRIDDDVMRAEALTRQDAWRETRHVLRRRHTARVDVPGLVLDLVDDGAGERYPLGHHRPAVACGSS
jgi:hypothetical protein